MFGALLGRMTGGGGTKAAPAAPVTQSDRLPPQLVASIGAMSVTFRKGPNDEDAIAYCILPSVGSFRLDGTNELSKRIADAWPEISAAQARKAAHLVAGEVGRRNWADMQGRRVRRSWVFDW
jgi:hypothetical protein